MEHRADPRRGRRAVRVRPDKAAQRIASSISTRICSGRTRRSQA
jgi:hypothetical protein